MKELIEIEYKGRLDVTAYYRTKDRIELSNELEVINFISLISESNYGEADCDVEFIRELVIERIRKYFVDIHQDFMLERVIGRKEDRVVIDRIYY